MSFDDKFFHDATECKYNTADVGQCFTRNLHTSIELYFVKDAFHSEQPRSFPHNRTSQNTFFVVFKTVLKFLVLYESHLKGMKCINYLV